MNSVDKITNFSKDTQYIPIFNYSIVPSYNYDHQNKIGIIMYGSLYNNLGILTPHINKKVYDGPKININLSGCNRFNNNLTRVIDYKNGVLMKTNVRVFNKTIGLEEAKRYVALREGNINYLILYSYKNDLLINFPEHLYEHCHDIQSKLRETSKRLKLDYVFMQAYPVKIKNIIKFLEENKNFIKNTKKYILKCNLSTLLDIEKYILLINK
jgi:hypothetical protein